MVKDHSSAQPHRATSTPTMQPWLCATPFDVGLPSPAQRRICSVRASCCGLSKLSGWDLAIPALGIMEGARVPPPPPPLLHNIENIRGERRKALQNIQPVGVMGRILSRKGLRTGSAPIHHTFRGDEGYQSVTASAELFQRAILGQSPMVLQRRCP